jgi:hypothetical protein
MTFDSPSSTTSKERRGSAGRGSRQRVMAYLGELRQGEQSGWAQTDPIRCTSQLGVVGFLPLANPARRASKSSARRSLITRLASNALTTAAHVR